MATILRPLSPHLLFRFYINFFLVLTNKNYQWFTCLPIVRRLSVAQRTILWYFLLSILSIIVSKVLLSLGYLWMDELQQAVSQFLPPSGGLTGGFNQPPDSTLPIYISDEGEEQPAKPSPLEISSILENRRKLEMWEKCAAIKADIIKLERVQGTFFRAELDFPTVTSTLSLTDAVDEALKMNMTGERGGYESQCLFGRYAKL